MKIREFDFRNNRNWLADSFFQKTKEDGDKALEAVLPIIQKVKNEKDAGLRELTKKFDGIDLDSFVLDPTQISVTISNEIRSAFLKAKENIEFFHKHQVPKNWEIQKDQNTLGIYYSPVDSVAVYAPGGKALYPSSVLMGVIPAKLAGVTDIQLVTPPHRDGLPNVLVWLAQELGIHRIVTLGGAQAIAAVAFGTETIPKSDFVVGPGNQYVAQAKSYLAGKGYIGIESPAGPSEVFIIADDSANPEWVACDMLSQAEHGEDSSAILATTSAKLIEKVSLALDEALRNRKGRIEMKSKAIYENSCLCLFSELAECFAFSNFIAPEHLEIQIANPKSYLSQIKHAGSVFLGPYSPVAMGDYISGTNHVLPTAGGSRFYSSLGVESFLKRITYQEISLDSLIELYPHVKVMSELEGLDEEHGTSVKVRLPKL